MGNIATLIVYIGLPGSGKDYCINDFLKTVNRDDYFIASTDGYIEEYAKSIGSTYNNEFQSYYKTAEKMMNEGIEDAIKNRKNVIWNQTNMTIKKRAKILSRFKSYEDKVAVSVVIASNVHAERLAHRAATEHKSIPDSVIQNFRSTYQEPTLDEGFNSILILDNSGDTIHVVEIKQA